MVAISLLFLSSVKLEPPLGSITQMSPNRREIWDRDKNHSKKLFACDFLLKPFFSLFLFLLPSGLVPKREPTHMKRQPTQVVKQLAHAERKPVHVGRKPARKGRKGLSRVRILDRQVRTAAPYHLDKEPFSIMRVHLGKDLCEIQAIQSWAMHVQILFHFKKGQLPYEMC